MKKVLSLIWALMLCLSLCACGGENQNIETQGMQNNQSSNEGNKTQNSQNNSDQNQSANTVLLLSKHTLYSDDDRILDVETFEYDAWGKLASYSCNHQTVTFIYDNANQLTEMCFSIEGKVSWRVELTYKDGQLVNEAMYNRRIDQPANITYAYSYSDHGNRITAVTVFDYEGNIVYSLKYEYNSNFQKIREHRSYIQNDQIYEYDTEGNMVKKDIGGSYYQVSYKGAAVDSIILVTDDGEIGGSVKCTHDTNGNIIECIYYDKNKFPVSREKFEYQSLAVSSELQSEIFSVAFIERLHCSAAFSALDFIK